MECFTADFLASEFGFWVDGWVLTIIFKHFMCFLEISLERSSVLTDEATYKHTFWR